MELTLLSSELRGVKFFSIHRFSFRAWLAGFGFALCLGAFHPVNPQTSDPDFQFRNDTTISIPLVKTTRSGKPADLVNLNILNTNRIGGDGFYPVDERVGVGLEFPINSYLTVAPSYLYRGSQPSRGVWQYEHRVRFDATIGKSWEAFGIKNRNRIERLVRHSRSDITRYRNRTTFTVPIERANRKLFDAYVSMEPFYDVTNGTWTNYEFFSGISRKFGGNVSANFAYLRRGNLSANSQIINGVSVNVTVSID